MAIQIGQSGPGDLPEISEINVTPFIDVMLVLLIIFMVAAPLSTIDLPVDLPNLSGVAQRKPDKPTYVSIKSGVGIAIGEQIVPRDKLVQKLDVADANKGRPIFVRADRTVHYGDLMQVLELLRNGGYTKVRLVALEGGSGPDGARP
ncbi:biopolymer transporter ExbD [Bradyrhizobium sp. WSM3983]|uniref:biopolymer transporter ExbD n=1 Tax=Bradyrhizobium sp. WSM3983 TaxID=1038867 RepID=UPI00040F9731|nr:biopolymer transporter ExbD [Bradyrhizobium sp. WSM3983]